MKQAKRILSLLLSLCLVLGLFPNTAFAASGNLPFTDVDTSDWYYNAVQYAYEKGMMNGTSTTTFSPNDTTTRGMIVTILHRMEGTPAAVGTAFTDVPTGQWYSDAVLWASANGIVDGYGGGMFGPSDPITREQMAAILNRYSQHKGYDTDVAGSIAGFSDASQVSSYAVASMGWAIGNGLISGIDNNILAPKGNATRAQVATILMRFCQNIADKANSTPAPDTTIDKTYTVTFDLNYGNDTRYDVKIVKAGEAVSKPTNPSRNGYSFGGWYIEKSGGKQFDFKQVITSDLTLYAHWTLNDSGSLGSNNGTNTNPGDNVMPTPPTDDYTEEDLDHDGVPDWMEDFFGISDNEEDSDGDEISDYDEIYLVGSDPAVPDSHLDKDGDGLSNLDEVKTYKTNPIRKDTDGDGLSDGEEIYTYGTDPLNDDTDGDGILDGDEIRLGLNPLEADVDELKTLTQTLDTNQIDDSLLEDNEAVPSVSGVSNKVLNRSVSVSKSSDISLADNRAVIGRGIDLAIDGDADLELSFTMTGAIDTLVVMEMDEENGWVPVEDTSYHGSTITVNDAKSGTYCVMDLDVLLPLLGVDIDALYGSIMSTYLGRSDMTIMSAETSAYSSPVEEVGDGVVDSGTTGNGSLIDVPIFSAEEDNEDEGSLSDIPDADDGIEEGAVSSGKDVEDESQLWAEPDEPNTDDSSENAASGYVILDEELNALVDEDLTASYFAMPSIMGQADIVFAVDTTGSMSDEISNVANNIIEFALTLTRVYNVNVNFALVDFRDITVDGSNSTRVIKNGTSNWYTNIGGFRDAVAGLKVDGGGDTPETAVDALEFTRRLDFRSTARKFIVLITDANYKTNNNYGISSMDEEIDLLVRDGIITSVVTAPSYESTYRDLYMQTGGIYANIYGNFSDELLRLADLIGGEVNEGNWILLNNYQYVSLANPLSPTSGDTDGDGLSDYEELKSPQQVDLTAWVTAMLILHKVPEDLIKDYFASSDEGGYYITVYPFSSNPALKDTDFDGRDDKEDAAPRNNQFVGKLKTDYATSGVSFEMDYSWFFSDNSVYIPELSKTSLLFSSAIYSGNDLNIQDSTGKDSTSGTSLPMIMRFFGFSNAKTESLSNSYDDNHLSEVGLGYRTVTYNGTTKNVVAVVVRGTNGTIEEWSSNFDIGNIDNKSKYIGWKTFLNHAGFDIAANRIMKTVDDYMTSNGLSSSNTVFWITGHSRGAAIANIIGAYYEQAGRTAYTYTFAAPNTTMAGNAKSYRSIFNVVNSDDFVPCLPMTGWGYTRYGRTASSSVASNYEKEWESLTGIWDYNPDTFGMGDTVDKLSRILTGDARVECYKYTCDDHGDGSNDTITIRNYGMSKDSREKAIGKIPANALPYCAITRYDGGWFSGWDFEVCQTPAYFMQILAAKMAGKIGDYRFVVELNIADRYESAKTAIIKSAIGGLEHPHYTESYYVLSNHIDAAWFR